MSDPLSGKVLTEHVRALADEIGPRPAGSQAVERARTYVRGALRGLGITEIEEQPFRAYNSVFYSLAGPVGTVALSNLLGILGPVGDLMGGALAAAGAYAGWRALRLLRHPLSSWAPTGPDANIIARIMPSGRLERLAVLLGHLDTHKCRHSQSPQRKHSLSTLLGANLGLLMLNSALQLSTALLPRRWMHTLRILSTVGVLGAIGMLVDDEREGFIDGANDNASAAAVLLGLGADLQQRPLKHTEVWLAFTGAEEVGCIGVQVMLDRYGERLRDATFIDLEMVGAGDIVYVTRHGLTPLAAYYPHPEALALAEKAARKHPELAIRPHDMPSIVEEVSPLVHRGFKAVLIAGAGDDGWLVNWHQYADNFSNIEPESLERAARFARAMLDELDRQ